MKQISKFKGCMQVCEYQVWNLISKVCNLCKKDKVPGEQSKLHDLTGFRISLFFL
jgi:hypothetical protein